MFVYRFTIKKKVFLFLKYIYNVCRKKKTACIWKCNANVHSSRNRPRLSFSWPFIKISAQHWRLHSSYLNCRNHFSQISLDFFYKVNTLCMCLNGSTDVYKKFWNTYIIFFCDISKVQTFFLNIFRTIQFYGDVLRYTFQIDLLSNGF